MASKGLKFTISAVDRTKAIFKGVGKSVRGLSSAVFSFSFGTHPSSSLAY